jgi:hypothetical protein
MTLREVKSPQDTRLVCALGHRYPGIVRVVQDQGHDSDGDPFWYPPRDDYNPSTCVVCGLKTWRRE